MLVWFWVLLLILGSFMVIKQDKTNKQKQTKTHYTIKKWYLEKSERFTFLFPKVETPQPFWIHCLACVQFGVYSIPRTGILQPGKKAAIYLTQGWRCFIPFLWCFSYMIITCLYTFLAVTFIKAFKEKVSGTSSKKLLTSSRLPNKPKRQIVSYL